MIRWHRFLALLRKELRQILRDRTLVISLIIPPTLQLAIFGFALNPTVNHLRMGLVDLSHSQESRELVSRLTANEVFDLTAQYLDSSQLDRAITQGELDAGLIIPPHFARLREKGGRAAEVQIVLNAMNANTAGIAQSYAARMIAEYNGSGSAVPEKVAAQVTFFYNPGLETSWFTVTGTFGILLILNGSLVGAATTIKEKDTGTLEQLLMTPAETGEIIIAKMAPLFTLLCLDIFLVVYVTRVLFGLPLRGSMALLFCSGALCALVGIGIGVLIGSLSKTALQAQLLSFFVNPPLALLSGATTPVEAMPGWLQPLTLLNPVRHFSLLARGIMIKGTGLETLYPHFLGLAGLATVLLLVSVRRFRSSLQ